MAENQMPPMHEQFPLWHREISLSHDRESIERSWRGVAELTKRATARDIEGLVRLVFKIRQAPEKDVLDNIRLALADPAADLQSSGRELEVLSGATLAALFAKCDGAAAVAALAVTTAAMAGGRKPNLPVDLVSLAEASIPEISESLRQRPDLNRVGSADTPKVDFEKAIAKVKEVPNWDGVSQAFALAADATLAAINSMARIQKSAIQTTSRFIKIQDEEIQMLWWLVGRRSWDFDCDFDALPPGAQPLVLSKEMADITELLPGPASTKALLARSGLKDRESTTIPAALNATDTEWLSNTVDGIDVSPVSQPVHFGIQRQLETGGGTSWVAGWAAAASVPPEHPMTPLSLAVQFYRERLLALGKTA
jgi:hypothetical protein